MNLRGLREHVLTLPRHEVAVEARMTEDRLRGIEEDDAPMTIAELEGLAMVYAMDADLLADEELTPAMKLGPALLARENGYQSFTTQEKFAILQASRAVHDLTALKRLVGNDPEIKRLDLKWRSKSDPPWKQGRDVAVLLRAKLSLGEEPIRSLSNLVATQLPWISVLYADLGRDGPSGLAFMSRKNNDKKL